MEKSICRQCEAPYSHHLRPHSKKREGRRYFSRVCGLNSSDCENLKLEYFLLSRRNKKQSRSQGCYTFMNVISDLFPTLPSKFIGHLLPFFFCQDYYVSWKDWSISRGIVPFKELSKQTNKSYNQKVANQNLASICICIWRFDIPMDTHLSFGITGSWKDKRDLLLLSSFNY